MGAIKFAVEQIGTPPFAMWEFAAYVRAMERFVLEMIFCQGWHKAGTSRPKTLFDFFAPLPAGQTFWIRRTEYLARTRRFEEWQLSASKSYLHFIRKQAPDIRACY
jgi:hypothetical protein